jgi:hypothetical protein
MTTAPGTPHVTGAARALVGAATATLPSGAVRDRYRLEHLGELSALPTRAQVQYAVGALATSWALRRALSKEKDMTVTTTRRRKPLLCQLNLHHRWQKQYNPAGEIYRTCRRCGKDDPGPPPRGTIDHPMPLPGPPW